MTLEELTETKHSLLELGNNDNVCLLKRDVGPTNVLPRYQNRCVTCVWLGLGLDLRPRGQRMRRIVDSGGVWQAGVLCALVFCAM